MGQAGFDVVAKLFGKAEQVVPSAAAASVVTVPPDGWDHAASGNWTQSTAAAAYDIQHCDFDIVDCTSLSSEAFNATYLIPNRPALLAGCARGWPAEQRWAKDQLVERYGDVVLSVGRIAFPETYGMRG